MSGIAPGGWNRWWHFLKSLGTADVKQAAFVISEWTTALSMKAYAEKYVIPSEELESLAVARSTARLRTKLRAWIESGALDVKLDSVRTHIHVRLAAIDASGFARAVRNLRAVLRDTKANVTLRIEECDAAELRRIVRKLRRYSDRVSLSLSETLRGVVEIDSSRFHLVYEPARA
jgi:hypothetical protein